MEYVASHALSRHGAEVGLELREQEQDEYKESNVEEGSTFLVELPTVSIEASQSAAARLRWRGPPADEGCLGAAGSALRPPACDSVRGCAERVSPIVGIAPKSTRASLRADVIAGLTVFVMVVPQSMSYAGIAGLDFVYGLYAAAVPAIAYAMFGSSGQLAVGPVAIVSLLVEAGLSDKLPRSECPDFYDDDDDNRRRLGSDTVGETCPKAYAQLVFVASFLVGIIQFGGSLLGMGFIINFLGHPVVSGFTSGSAIVIGLSQLKHWFGVETPSSQYVYETIGNLYAKRGDVRWMTVILGVASYLALWSMRQAAARWPKRLSWLKPASALIISLASLLVIVIFPDLKSEYRVRTIGKIPRGLPPFSLDQVFADLPSYVLRVLPTAASVALVGYMESIAIGKNLAAKHGYELDAGRELAAIGLANLLGSSFSGYPVAGSFSRSAVSSSVGARTPLAGLLTGFLVLASLVAIPSVARKLPRFVLATIVIASVVNLVELGEAKRLWRIRKADGVLWGVAFLGVLFLGAEYGLALAVAMSLLLVIAESVRPQIAVLWKLPGTAIYRSVKQGESRGQFVQGVLVVRVGASMFFANVAFIKEKLAQLARDFESVDSKVDGKTEYVVVEMTPVTSIDSTAVHVLEDIVKDFATRGVRVCFASVGSRVEETLKRAGVQSRVGFEWFHENVDAAVAWCIRHRAATRVLRARGPTEEDTKEEVKESAPLLVLAGKHRVVDTAKTYDAPVLLAPEKRALELATGIIAVPPTVMLPEEEQMTQDEQVELFKVLKEAAVTGKWEGNALEALGKPRVVVLPDDRDPALMLEMAIDAADRPGLLADISETLVRSLTLNLKQAHAVVVHNHRSVSLWRCEVPDRGLEKVLAAVKKSTDVIPKILLKEA